MDWKQRILEAVTGKVAASQFRNTDLKRGGSDSLKDRPKVAHNAGSLEDLRSRTRKEDADRVERRHGFPVTGKMKLRVDKIDPEGTKFGIPTQRMTK